MNQKLAFTFLAYSPRCIFLPVFLEVREFIFQWCALPALFPSVNTSCTSLTCYFCQRLPYLFSFFTSQGSSGKDFQDSHHFLASRQQERISFMREKQLVKERFAHLLVSYYISCRPRRWSSPPPPNSSACAQGQHLGMEQHLLRVQTAENKL